MNVDWFDYHLPEHLIAQTPLPNRSESRLLTLNRRTGEIGHYQFEQLHRFLNPGDLLVLNDTRVIPARLYGVKADTGARVEVLLLKNLGNDRWEVLAKPAKRIRRGTTVLFYASHEAPGGGKPLMRADVEEEREMGSRVLHFRYDGIFGELLDQIGHMPLPPYIKEQLPDRERYQTVYARHEGSVAAPTAGLHFTDAYLRELEAGGIGLTYVTLHVGLGTFRPVTVDRVEDHAMHSEYYHITRETADRIQQTRERGGRVVAVGTTSARTLETAALRGNGKVEAGSGWTDIFIYPGFTFQAVDALITNFHLPKSTLIMLVSALAGRDLIMRAYEEAVKRQYRFFSFGDAMLIY